MDRLSTTAANRGSAIHNQPFNYTHTHSIQQFKNAMLEAGIEAPESIIGDGKLHRFKIAGKLDGAYALHLDGKPAGYFQDFKQDIKKNWKLDGKFQPLSLIQRQQFAFDRQRQEAERNAEEAAKQNAAADKARYIWHSSTLATTHLYLNKKRVKPHNLRLGRNNMLVVPIYDGSKTLVNLQFISETGGKRFLSGGKKKACFSVIGKPDGIRPILIAEGWATGASLHEDTGHFTVVALDAGNLEPVAVIVRKLYPDSQIIVCGDNDESGVGQKAAKAAALAVGGKFIIPVTPGHDFNDMLSIECVQ